VAVLVVIRVAVLHHHPLFSHTGEKNILTYVNMLAE
jgi:hypothetical protein